MQLSEIKELYHRTIVPTKLQSFVKLARTCCHKTLDLLSSDELKEGMASFDKVEDIFPYLYVSFENNMVKIYIKPTSSDGKAWEHVIDDESIKEEVKKMHNDSWVYDFKVVEMGFALMKKEEKLTVKVLFDQNETNKKEYFSLFEELYLEPIEFYPDGAKITIPVEFDKKTDKKVDKTTA